MNKLQKKHLDRVRASFNKEVTEKYIRGAKAHQDTLLKMSVYRLLKELQGEAIDTYVYCETALEKILKRGY